MLAENIEIIRNRQEYINSEYNQSVESLVENTLETEGDDKNEQICGLKGLVYEIINTEYSLSQTVESQTDELKSSQSILEDLKEQKNIMEQDLKLFKQEILTKREDLKDLDLKIEKAKEKESQLEEEKKYLITQKEIHQETEEHYKTLTQQCEKIVQENQVLQNSSQYLISQTDQYELEYTELERTIDGQVQLIQNTKKQNTITQDLLKQVEDYIHELKTLSLNKVKIKDQEEKYIQFDPLEYVKNIKKSQEIQEMKELKDEDLLSQSSQSSSSFSRDQSHIIRGLKYQEEHEIIYFEYVSSNKDFLNSQKDEIKSTRDMSPLYMQYKHNKIVELESPISNFDLESSHEIQTLPQNNKYKKLIFVTSIGLVAVAILLRKKFWHRII